MQRITITIEDDLLAEIDAAARERGYQNRSEVIRDLARAGLQQSAEAAPSGQCVAALVYVAALAHDETETSQDQQDKFPKTVCVKGGFALHCSGPTATH